MTTSDRVFGQLPDGRDVRLLTIGSAGMFHIYVSNYPGDVKLGTLGRLVPGYDARIVGEDGHDVAPGEIGTLWVRGASDWGTDPLMDGS